MQLVDIEAALTAWLSSRFPGIRVCTELPAQLVEVIGDAGGVVRVTRIGGGTSTANPALDTPTVDVDCFGDTRIDARALAVQVQSALLLDLPGSDIAGGSVPKHGVTQTLGPAWRPYDDTDVRQIGATYSIKTRARSSGG